MIEFKSKREIKKRKRKKKDRICNFFSQVSLKNVNNMKESTISFTTITVVSI